MKLALLLLAASAGCFLLANTLLFLGLQVLAMNHWQGALLGIAMYSTLMASPVLALLGIGRGVIAFKYRRRASQTP